MSPLLIALKIVYFLLGSLSTGVLVYQIVIALLPGRRGRQDRMPSQERAHRIALVVAARNEEAVIGQLLDSLAGQDYPKDRYDVYVIADNCTDRTADVARAHGALVYKREDEILRGKGHVLHWFFNILQREKPQGYYDAYGIFDADNLVDPGYLKAMNRRLLMGDDIIEGYRDIKNPEDSWVSGAYAIYFWCISHFFLRARQRLGLSGLVSGTGFLFRSSLIADGGWSTQTITEDCEFSLLQVLAGRRVTFAEDAIFYDEQPVTLRQAIRQRYRWAIGSLQCFELFFGKMLRGAITGRSFTKLDMLMYLMAVPGSAIIAANTCVGATIRYMGQAHWYEIALLAVASLAGSVVIMLLHGALTVKLEGKSLRAMFRGVLGWPIFLLSWTYISLFAIFYRDTTWKPIQHTSTVDIDAMQNNDDLHV